VYKVLPPFLSPYSLPLEWHPPNSHFTLLTFILRSTFHISENIWYFPFSAWIISLNKMIFSSIHFPKNDKIFILTDGWITLHYVYISHFLYPFIRQWTLVYLVYESRCYKHEHEGVSIICYLIPYWTYAREWYSRIIW
jgi:hypothetical protein